jgi:uncharacterized membrane protein
MSVISQRAVPAERDGLTVLSAAITLAAIVWLSIIIVSPWALAHGSGRLLAVSAYEIGARICHQRPERSFHLAGVQMPVCARCFGLYVSGALGLSLAWLQRRRLSPIVARLALGVAALPIALTVILERIGTIAPSNVERMLTALPLGFVAGLVIVGSLAGAARGLRYDRWR